MPITAAGCSRSALSGKGREAQSTAFFKTPGMEALYSGVLKSNASAAAISSRRFRTEAGGSVSWSSSKGGICASSR